MNDSKIVSDYLLLLFFLLIFFLLEEKKERIDKVEDVLKLGDVVKVKYIGLDKKGRMDFSIKDAE